MGAFTSGPGNWRSARPSWCAQKGATPSRAAARCAVSRTARAVSLLPSVKGIEPTAALPKPAPEKGGGYSLTEHVKQYYQTTRI